MKTKSVICYVCDKSFIVGQMMREVFIENLNAWVIVHSANKERFNKDGVHYTSCLQYIKRAYNDDV